ncbi:MAG: FecR domain-containing protein [Prolixibacteraceae bacterium]
MKNQDFDKQILENFKTGRHSRSEYLRVKRWFKDGNQSNLQQAMKSHWEDLPAHQPLDDRLGRLLDALRAQIGFPRHRGTLSVFGIYKKVAAILFIPLLIGCILWALQPLKSRQESFASIHSPQGARTEFTLPDGSTGWLNSGSMLTYPVEFNNHREVTVKGEAYFKVVRQDGEPFHVKTDELSVRVLGTSFNVAAYPDEAEVNVILEKGKIKICGIKNQPDYVVMPDEKFSYNLRRKTTKISQVDAASQLSWTRGLLLFRGEPLSEVMRKLGRWYNVDFEIRDKQLQNYSFKATFKDEQLEEILRMIALTTPMKYRIEERKTTDNGIYVKRKIIIEKS